MRMLAMSAAAALLMSTAPAMAQTADPDAMCLIATGMRTGVIEARADLTDDDVMALRYAEGALQFYAGVLHQRVPEAQLGPMLKAASNDFYALPTDAKDKLTGDCIEAVQPVLAGIAKALRD